MEKLGKYGDRGVKDRIDVVVKEGGGKDGVKGKVGGGGEMFKFK